MNKTTLIAVAAALAVVILGVVLLQGKSDPASDPTAAASDQPAAAVVEVPKVDWTVPGASDVPPTSAEEMLADRVLGSPDAPVTVYDYSSLTCPHCAKFHTETLPFVKRDYIDTGKVRFIYQDFPLDALALGASVLARCAPPKQYYKILSMLFHEQMTWATAEQPYDSLVGMVALAGLSREDAQACLQNEAVIAGVQNRAEADGTQYAIKKTPSFVVNGQLVTGEMSYEDFAAILDRAATPNK